MDGAPVAGIEGVAGDGGKRPQAGPAADQEERLIDPPRRIEVFAAGAVEVDLVPH